MADTSQRKDDDFWRTSCEGREHEPGRDFEGKPDGVCRFCGTLMPNERQALQPRQGRINDGD